MSSDAIVKPQDLILNVIAAAEDMPDPLAGLVEKTAIDAGAAFMPEALQSLATLKTHNRAAFEALRSRLKKAGCRVTTLDDAIAEENGDVRGRGLTQADILIDLAQTAALFHTPDGSGFADLDINNHRETWPIRSKGFSALARPAILRGDSRRAKFRSPAIGTERHRGQGAFRCTRTAGPYQSYMNGRQIVFPPLTKRQVVRRYKDKRNPKSQQYAIFKAVDLKTRKQIETSCDPAKLSNYFEPDSNLPLEMSPVFFSADVLLKYKSDPTKYDLKDRSISCRGTWHLETFDVNEAGQVHTYLVYLSRLPYREQLYWQSFNILPKGFVSRRAFKTDFMGDWDTDYDSLNEVKRKIERLDEMAPDWWNYRGKKVLAAVHNPVTTSDSEWAESILALDQLVIEGFQEKALRSLAQSLKRAPHYEWRSLKLVEECLSGHGVSEVDAAATVTSLRRIRELRTTVKGHSAQQKKAAAVKAALTDHGTFRAHFENLTANCDESLRQIMATFGVAG